MDRQCIDPPQAKIIPKADKLHGDVRIDNYFWLRERSNPKVIEYLEAENEYTEAWMITTIIPAPKRVSSTVFIAEGRDVSRQKKR
jgi:protease II